MYFIHYDSERHTKKSFPEAKVARPEITEI